MAAHVLAIIKLLLLFLPPAACMESHPPQGNRNYLSKYSSNNPDMVALNDLLDKERPARASPECWRASILVISERKSEDAVRGHQNIFSSGNAYCSSMTHDEQEMLALELAKCQLMKEGSSIFDQSRLSNGVEHTTVQGNSVEYHTPDQLCPVAATSNDAYNVYSCFHLMTDFAKNLYHQVLFHINDVCTRLTEEMIIDQKEKSARALMHASLIVSQQMEDIMTGNAVVTDQVQAQASLLDEQSLLLELQSAKMRAQQSESERLHNAQSTNLREQHYVQSALMEEQSTKTREHFALLEKQSTKVKKHHNESERIHKLAVEKMRDQTAWLFKEQAEQMKNQTKLLIEDQASKVKEQQRELEHLRKVISDTHNEMRQPLSSISAYIRIVTNGVSLVMSLVIFIVSINITWIFTTPPLLRRARRYIFSIFLAGLLVEIAVLWLKDQDLLKSSDKAGAIAHVRLGTRAIAVAMTTLSFVLSCVVKPTCAGNDPRPLTVDDLVKSQLELFSRTNATPSDAGRQNSTALALPDSFENNRIEYRLVPNESETSSAIIQPTVGTLEKETSIGNFHPYNQNRGFSVIETPSPVPPCRLYTPGTSNSDVNYVGCNLQVASVINNQEPLTGHSLRIANHEMNESDASCSEFHDANFSHEDPNISDSSMDQSSTLSIISTTTTLSEKECSSMKRKPEDAANDADCEEKGDEFTHPKRKRRKTTISRS